MVHTAAHIHNLATNLMVEPQLFVRFVIIVLVDVAVDVVIVIVGIVVVIIIMFFTMMISSIIIIIIIFVQPMIIMLTPFSIE